MWNIKTESPFNIQTTVALGFFLPFESSPEDMELGQAIKKEESPGC